MSLSSNQSTWQCDVVIVGSGFSGSILAWLLVNSGRSVVVLDRSKHPRFAIGESSTPLADFLLEQISEEFGLAALKPLSRWGSWQCEYPNLRAGIKRGFSYYTHQTGKPFHESSEHESSLLVAASASNDLSDTHWMRSDVDTWLCNQARQCGAVVLEQVEVHELSEGTGCWNILASAPTQRILIQTTQIIDASGGGGVIARAQRLKPLDDELRVRNSAMFGHFTGLGSMSTWNQAHGLPTDEDPFDGDNAAQHHMIRDGWIWMLRFQGEMASVGLVQPCGESPWQRSEPTQDELLDHWTRTVAAYPTLVELFENAKLVGPAWNGAPALQWLPKIGRLWSRAAGPGWAMLPGALGIVDPLHSTGIAHALWGVRRVGRLLLHGGDVQAWDRYSSESVAELRWIDRLVACCYRAYDESFTLFAAVCSFYFVCAIHSERQLAACGDLPEGFLMHRSPGLAELLSWIEMKVEECVLSESPTIAREQFIDEFRVRLQPWNDVGLLDPTLKNRIGRSIAPKKIAGD